MSEPEVKDSGKPESGHVNVADVKVAPLMDVLPGDPSGVPGLGEPEPSRPSESPDKKPEPRQAAYPNLRRGNYTPSNRLGTGRPRNVIRDDLCRHADEAIPHLKRLQLKLFAQADRQMADGNEEGSLRTLKMAAQIFDSFNKVGMGEVKVTIDDVALLRIVHGVLKAEFDATGLARVMADLEQAVLGG